MAKDNPLKKLSAALDDLVAHAALPPCRTEAELRDDLRAQGIDPDRLLGNLEAILQDARAQARKERFATAATAREKALVRLDGGARPHYTRAELEAHYLALTAGAPALAQFRDFTSISDQDLEKMIEELEYLSRPDDDR